MRYRLLDEEKIRHIIANEHTYTTATVSMAVELLESRKIMKLKNCSLDVKWLESDEL